MILVWIVWIVLGIAVLVMLVWMACTALGGGVCGIGLDGLFCFR